MITAAILKNAIISAAENIRRYSDEVDDINVFPVPDGDTGTNLTLTLTGCAKAVAKLPDILSAGEFADKAAGALLRSARGNSGVIFSLIFKGFAKSIEGLDEIDAVSLAKALEAGSDEAYASIEKPTEGTMLTVIRLAAAKASSAAAKGCTAEETFMQALAGAEASLRTTTNLLPALKKHGVVDAGGQGLIHIMRGMAGTAEASSQSIMKEEEEKNNRAHNTEYIYCTEFLINSPRRTDIASLRTTLSGFGNSTAVAEHSGIIKVHVHTNSPDKALSKGLELGELSDIKIDNMRIQSE